MVGEESIFSCQYGMRLLRAALPKLRRMTMESQLEGVVISPKMLPSLTHLDFCTYFCFGDAILQSYGYGLFALQSLLSLTVRRGALSSNPAKCAVYAAICAQLPAHTQLEFHTKPYYDGPGGTFIHPLLPPNPHSSLVIMSLMHCSVDLCILPLSLKQLRLEHCKVQGVHNGLRDLNMSCCEARLMDVMRMTSLRVLTITGSTTIAESMREQARSSILAALPQLHSCDLSSLSATGLTGRWGPNGYMVTAAPPQGSVEKVE
jgi:hypothetical protein